MPVFGTVVLSLERDDQLSVIILQVNRKKHGEVSWSLVFGGNFKGSQNKKKTIYHHLHQQQGVCCRSRLVPALRVFCLHIVPLVDVRFFCHSEYIHSLIRERIHRPLLINVGSTCTYNLQKFYLNIVYVSYFFYFGGLIMLIPKKRYISAASVYSKDQFSHPYRGVGVVILNTVNSVRLLFVCNVRMNVPDVRGNFCC
jgi:hypothetical protein